MPLVQIVPDLFVFKDFVNVYVLKTGTRALLIDFGNGSILNELKDLGIDAVDCILHTHYHRDQCAGDDLALEKGIPINGPAHERKLFEHATEFWRTRSPYDMYYFQPSFLVSTFDIPLALALKDKQNFSWNNLTIQAFETSGHTPGSLSYVVKWGGKILAFTGDLIHAGGKVLNYFDLEYIYNDNGEEGIRRTLASLKTLQKLKPDILLPSHGPIITDPSTEISKLKEGLFNARYYLGSKHSSVAPFNGFIGIFKRKFKKVRPEKLFSASRILHKSGLLFRQTTFIIIGQHQNCFLIDFGGGGDPSTMDERTLFTWLDHHGVKTIDFIFPSHYHDDHVGGIPLLQRKYHVPVHCITEMVDILEHPTDYRMACLIDTPIRVDKFLHDRETFTWEDCECQVFHFPGQTEFHGGMLVTIEGKRIFFAGDSVVDTILFDRATNLNGFNWCRLGSDVGYMKCAKLLLELEPEYLAISHCGFAPVTRAMLQQYYDQCALYEETIENLVPWDNPNFGLDPNWIAFKPIYLSCRPGATIHTNLVVRNYSPAASTLQFSLNLPTNWKAERLVGGGKVESKMFQSFPIGITIPENVDFAGRTIITADITWNGNALGPLADLTIDHGFIPPFTWKGWTTEHKTNQVRWMFSQIGMAKRFFI